MYECLNRLHQIKDIIGNLAKAVLGNKYVLKNCCIEL